MYYILRLLPILILTHPSLENEMQEESNFNTKFFTAIEKTDALKLFDDSIFMKETDALTSELDQLIRPHLKQLSELSEVTHQMYSLYKEYRDNNVGNKSDCLNIPGDVADIDQTCFSSFQIVKSLVTSFVTFLGEISVCANESIFKQLACYLGACKDFTAIVKEYSPEVKEILDELTAKMKTLQDDLHSCFTGNSSK